MLEGTTTHDANPTGHGAELLCQPPYPFPMPLRSSFQESHDACILSGARGATPPTHPLHPPTHLLHTTDLEQAYALRALLVSCPMPFLRSLVAVTALFGAVGAKVAPRYSQVVGPYQPAYICGSE